VWLKVAQRGALCRHGSSAGVASPAHTSLASAANRCCTPRLPTQRNSHAGIGGDLVEEVQLIDTFTHPKTQRTSHCYRITYRSMERSLTDEEINALQDAVRKGVAEELKVELR
jgi:hypothetical protein